MTPEHIELVQSWGYWLMFAAAIIEGETFLILGGVAIAMGLFELQWVVILSVLGCLLHDAFFFYTGYFSGPKLLKRKPEWQPKVDKIGNMLQKYGFWLIIAFRFAYGLRTIIPFAMGVSGMKVWKFSLFDFIGAWIWVLVFVLAGYYFGNAFIVILEKLSLTHLLKHHWIITLLMLAVVISSLSFSILYLIKRRRRRQQKNG
ncbi:MAG: DedA family protein [Francisellaceae bacterium]